MKKISDIPNVKKYFNDENLAVQDVYKAKENYDVAYINPKLYEELFEEKYDWEKASKHISEYFSITLDKEKSTFELVGRGYADKQEDSTGIALNGNLGSGRAYFYGEVFNIKGDKTTLATDEFKKIAEEKKLRLFKADWTNRNKAISEALALYGRNSIPLYVYYPTNSNSPVILPQILTNKALYETIK
jgi:hypothetical protein